MLRIFLFIFVMGLLSGCLGAKIVKQPVPMGIPNVSGFVVNADLFQKGGTLALAAFKPGPGAAANEQTDRLSLMLIKGIKESLSPQKTTLTIVEDDQKEPNLVLEGYIEEYGQRKNKAHLAVDGNIWLQATGEKVFVFQASKTIDLKKEKPMDAAYQLGRVIGDFIVSRATKEIKS